MGLFFLKNTGSLFCRRNVAQKILCSKARFIGLLAPKEMQAASGKNQIISQR